MVTVSVSAAAGSEGDALSLPVTLTGKVSVDVVLGWSTAEGTAFSGTDYTAVSSGTLSIAAGQISGALTVSTAEDTLTEADETFTVTIAGTMLPIGVSLGDATATGTIEDDDTLTASVQADGLSVNEGSSASFTASLDGATSTADVVLTYSGTGSATSGDDFTAPSGSLTISSGSSSGTITIATILDEELEPGETMIVTLTGVSTAKGTAEFTATPATVAITDTGR